jgi:hypothetical protein
LDGAGETTGLPPQVDRAAIEREASRLLSCAGAKLKWYRGATVTQGAEPVGWTRLSMAVGRVAAHELVHLLAPELARASIGLMGRTVSGELLARSGLQLDAGTCAAVANDLGRSGAPSLATLTPSRPEWRAGLIAG